MDYIQIGGEERPFHFSNKVAYTYETTTGRPYLQDVYECAQNMFNAAQVAQTGTDGAISAALTVRVSLVTDLAFVGFQYAHRKAEIQIGFSKDDLAAWIIEEPDAASKIMEAIILAISPKGEPEPQTKKKNLKVKAQA